MSPAKLATIFFIVIIVLAAVLYFYPEADRDVCGLDCI